VVRTVQKELGRKVPDTLNEVFRTNARVVFGLPELDPYAAFRREPLVAPPGGLPELQSEPDGKRLFIYVGSDMPGLDQLLQSVVDLDIPVEAFLRGEVGPLPAFLRARGFTVHDRAPPLKDVLSRASHVLTQGGAMTSASAFTAGRPQLVTPLHGESEINLGLLTQRGVAVRLEKPTKESNLRARLRAFLDDHRLSERAQIEAKRIAIRPLPDGKIVAAESIRLALS
jgi:UDP:flavonoid glycosyltransferase YjiC (YdhE family)